MCLISQPQILILQKPNMQPMASGAAPPASCRDPLHYSYRFSPLPQKILDPSLGGACGRYDPSECRIKMFYLLAQQLRSYGSWLICELSKSKIWSIGKFHRFLKSANNYAHISMKQKCGRCNPSEGAWVVIFCEV